MSEILCCPFGRASQYTRNCVKGDCFRYIVCMQERIEAIGKFSDCEEKHKELIEFMRAYILKTDVKK